MYKFQAINISKGYPIGNSSIVKNDQNIIILLFVVQFEFIGGILLCKGQYNSLEVGGEW